MVPLTQYKNNSTSFLIITFTFFSSMIKAPKQQLGKIFLVAALSVNKKHAAYPEMFFKNY